MPSVQQRGDNEAHSLREIPWAELEAQLKAWLASLQQAMAKQQPAKVRLRWRDRNC